MTWTLALKLQTDPDALRAARRMIYAVFKQEGWPEREAREFELAIGEALGNARMHAYADGAGPLTIDIRSDTMTCAVAVHDAGAPVSLPTVPTSLPSDPARRDYSWSPHWVMRSKSRGTGMGRA